MVIFYKIFLAFCFSLVQVQIASGNNSTATNSSITTVNVNKTEAKVVNVSTKAVNKTNNLKTYVETEIGPLQTVVNDTQKQINVQNRTNTEHPNEEIVHKGREHVSEEPPTHKVVNNTSAASFIEYDKLHLSEKNDHKNSMPRKGADYGQSNVTNSATSNTTSTTNSSSVKNVTNITVTTTTTIRPIKPTVTIGGDDTLSNQSSKDELSMRDFHGFTENRTTSSTNFVVPIVAVILSVPLVAIVISVLYKRGKEWWQHRHYSRMDFLIDGMYNS